MGGMRLGHVAYGGRSVADWVHLVLTGEGCGMVGDWTAFDAFIRAQAPDIQHRRVDLALDVFDGSVTYEHAEALWEVGGYDPARGARPRRDRQGYPEGGRTFYVGSRSTSDRYLRLYEKGMQKGHHPWGEGFDPRWWFRLEVEMKPANGPIPLDVIAAREAFFAGAAPFFGQMVAGIEGRRAPRDPLNDIAAEVSEAVRHLRRSAGPSLRVLLDVYGGPQALIEALTSGVPRSERLVQAGAAILQRADLAKFGV
jgi:phage replication initiation protein